MSAKSQFAGTAPNSDLFRMGKAGLREVIETGNPRSARVKQAKAELARRKANQLASKA